MKDIRDWILTGKADRQLRKLPLSLQKDIVAKLDFYIQSGHPLSLAKRLTNYELGEYRFRINKDYRVVFDVEDDLLLITEIGHRSKMYK
jgi:mRNA interferase RelE/StbE